jgi:hypothetical protein
MTRWFQVHKLVSFLVLLLFLQDYVDESGSRSAVVPPEGEPSHPLKHSASVASTQTLRFCRITSTNLPRTLSHLLRPLTSLPQTFLHLFRPPPRAIAWTNSYIHSNALFVSHLFQPLHKPSTNALASPPTPPRALQHPRISSDPSTNYRTVDERLHGLKCSTSVASLPTHPRTLHKRSDQIRSLG